MEDPCEGEDVSPPSTQRKTRCQTTKTLGKAFQKGTSKTGKRGDDGASRNTRQQTYRATDLPTTLLQAVRRGSW